MHTVLQLHQVYHLPSFLLFTHKYMNIKFVLWEGWWTAGNMTLSTRLSQFIKCENPWAERSVYLWLTDANDQWKAWQSHRWWLVKRLVKVTQRVYQIWNWCKLCNRLEVSNKVKQKIEWVMSLISPAVGVCAKYLWKEKCGNGT